MHGRQGLTELTGWTRRRLCIYQPCKVKTCQSQRETKAAGILPYRKTLITSERMGPKPASARIVLTAGKDRQTGHNRFRLVLNPAKEVPRAGFDFPMLQYLIEVTAYFLGVCMKRCICYSRVSAVLTDEGFVVECPKCGRTTIPFQNINQAIEE